MAQNPNGILATHDGESLKMRVFQYLFADGRRVFFRTSREKEVYKQLTVNAEAAFRAYPADFAPVVSLNGRAVFVDAPEIKARILEENPLNKGIYKSPDNPVFAVFYIEAAEARTFSLA